MFARRLVPVMLAFSMVATVLVAVAPSASAKAADTVTEVSAGSIDAPIKPLSGFQSSQLNIKYTYTAGVGVVPTVINLVVTESPPWAVVSISPSSVSVNILTTENPGAQVTRSPAVQPKILVSTTADAPAFTPGTIKISASAVENGDLKPSVGLVDLPVQADFFSIIDASAAQTITIARPQTTVTYPITVTNLGNANTKVFFSVGETPAGFQVQPPIPVTLDSRQQGGKNNIQTVNLNILTPYHNGYLNEVGSVTMDITSNYALDSKQKGDTTRVSVLTTTRGFYVPGFESVVVLGALVGMALVVRRRAQA